MASLDDFAVGKERKKGCASFWSTLPEEIREQIVESPASSEVVVEWLRSLGFSQEALRRELGRQMIEQRDRIRDVLEHVRHEDRVEGAVVDGHEIGVPQLHGGAACEGLRDACKLHASLEDTK